MGLRSVTEGCRRFHCVSEVLRPKMGFQMIFKEFSGEFRRILKGFKGLSRVFHRASGSVMGSFGTFQGISGDFRESQKVLGGFSRCFRWSQGVSGYLRAFRRHSAVLGTSRDSQRFQVLSVLERISRTF